MIMPWRQHRSQWRQGLRIAEPSSAPDAKNTLANESIFDDHWDDDTQPGLGHVPTLEQEKKSMASKSTVERTNLMFVFGRYRPGFNLNIVVARDKGYKCSTRTLPEFKMLNINDEFPVVINDGKTAIVGDVYHIAMRTFDFMDGLEECPSTQGRDIVTLENGMRAHMYILPKWKAPNREEEVISGDWVEWKRNEKSRERDKKEKFLAMMAKGKEEAARRRELEEKQMAEYIARNSTTGNVSNPTKHQARVWDPIRNKWDIVPPDNDTDQRHQVTTYPGKNGKKVIHVSDVDMSMLRAKLVVDGHNVPATDSAVRAKIMSLYGVWFEID